MNKPYVLGITGKKGCGKNTLARKIREEFVADDLRVDIRPMSDYLKDVIAVMLNIPRGRLEDREYKEKQCVIDGWGTNREVMQGIGQALRDGFRSTVWIDLWLKDYYACLGSGNIQSPPDLIIIPDIRLNNEAEMVHDLGGEIVKLEFGLFSDKKYETNDTNVTEQGISKELVDTYIRSDISFYIFMSGLKQKTLEKV